MSMVDTAGGGNPDFSLTNANDFIGREIGVSNWFVVTQDDINAFGRATHDEDPNHMDPDWAKSKSPFGQTVAFGFQTLSLLTHLGKNAGMVPVDAGDEFNYGFERVRFSNAVPAGSKIRCRMVLKNVRRKNDGSTVLTYESTVEIEGDAKPALVADWLVMCRSRVD